jgi:hypothetical protein
MLWLVIAGEKTSEMGLSGPVELKNFPKDLELTGDAGERGGGAPARAAPASSRAWARQTSPPTWTCPGVQEGSTS